MIIALGYRDGNAERVPGHKFVLTSARTISGNFVSDRKLIPYFSCKDAITPFMYNAISVHHDLILVIVLPSQQTMSSCPFTMQSMVWAQ